MVVFAYMENKDDNTDHKKMNNVEDSPIDSIETTPEDINEKLLKDGKKEDAVEEEMKEKDEIDEDIVEERIYTIPLGKTRAFPRKKRSKKAINIVKRFIIKHMKLDIDSVRIDKEVNEKIWERGITLPPRKIRIRALKNSEGLVSIKLVEGT
jgi:large subunit ribosomal protein L31e